MVTDERVRGPSRVGKNSTSVGGSLLELGHTQRRWTSPNFPITTEKEENNEVYCFVVLFSVLRQNGQPHDLNLHNLSFTSGDPAFNTLFVRIGSLQIR